MSYIPALMAEISKPQYKGLKPAEILAIITDKSALPIPPPPPEPTTYSIADSIGASGVSEGDIIEAMKISAKASAASDAQIV